MSPPTEFDVPPYRFACPPPIKALKILEFVTYSTKKQKIQLIADESDVVLIKKGNGITQILRTLEVNLYTYYFYQIERAKRCILI